MGNTSIVDETGHYTRLTHDECGTLWFHRFTEGMSNRMGKVHLPNVASSNELLLKVLQEVENRISGATETSSVHDWVIMSVYCVITYVLSLRGDEGFLIHLKETLSNRNNHPDHYTVIAPLGRLKGSKIEAVHLFSSVNVTESEINIKRILNRALNMKVQLGFRDGPLISDQEGYLWSSNTIDDMMHEVLYEIFMHDRKLFPLKIKNEEDIKKGVSLLPHVQEIIRYKSH